MTKTNTMRNTTKMIIIITMSGLKKTELLSPLVFALALSVTLVIVVVGSEGDIEVVTGFVGINDEQRKYCFKSIFCANILHIIYTTFNGIIFFLLTVLTNSRLSLLTFKT